MKFPLIYPRCNYSTSRKSNVNHITRKRICMPVNKDVPIKDIAESYGIEISSTDFRQRSTQMYTQPLDT